MGIRGPATDRAIVTLAPLHAHSRRGRDPGVRSVGARQAARSLVVAYEAIRYGEQRVRVRRPELARVTQDGLRHTTTGDHRTVD